VFNGIGVLGWGVGGLEAQTRDVRHGDHAAIAPTWSACAWSARS
jgi:hypothetical protein